MCDFNTFDSAWPFFGAASRNKKRGLQDRAEDIAFEEVKESAKNQPEIDERARAVQISKTAAERSSDLLEKSPMLGLLAVTMFVAGATWADEHPRSSYGSREAWHSAQHAETHRLLTESEAAKGKDILFETLVFAMFADGALWANDNPAPTL